MACTHEDIKRWLKDAKKEGATHMLVVCDTYDWDDYPVSVMPGQDVHKVYDHYNGPNMQRVMEVYNLSMNLDKQLAEHRANNF